METARLYARELREEDAPRVHAMTSRPESSRAKTRLLFRILMTFMSHPPCTESALCRNGRCAVKPAIKKDKTYSCSNALAVTTGLA